LAGYIVSHNFNVPYVGFNDGVKVWSQYRDEIEKYAAKICQQLGSQFYEQLRPARNVLADHIHEKYYDRLPKWPSVGETNVASVELDTGSSYSYNPYHIVWNCLGWVTVTDERPYREV
jgi:hypothetical protein